MIFIQRNNPAQKDAAVIRAAVAHHGAARLFLKVGRRKITVEDLFNVFTIFFRDNVLACEIAVNGAAVDICHDGHVFRPFHAALYF